MAFNRKVVEKERLEKGAKNSNGKNSLHSVMKELYQEFALKSRGYSENDFENLCVKYGGAKVEEIFKRR